MPVVKQPPSTHRAVAMNWALAKILDAPNAPRSPPISAISAVWASRARAAGARCSLLLLQRPSGVCMTGTAPRWPAQATMRGCKLLLCGTIQATEGHPGIRVRHIGRVLVLPSAWTADNDKVGRGFKRMQHDMHSQHSRLYVSAHHNSNARLKSSRWSPYNCMYITSRNIIMSCRATHGSATPHLLSLHVNAIVMHYIQRHDRPLRPPGLHWIAAAGGQLPGVMVATS